SGYSDIAIGSARVMGYDLMSNFNRPYHARSIADFWRRWHISLSSWFRDYLYFPLGGSRVPTRTRWCFNVMVVFLVSGLWHGANWTFVAWGALHGIYLVIGRLTKRTRERFFARLTLLPRQFKRIWPGFQIALTFALTTFAWIFFRADSLSDALLVVGRMATGMSRYLSGLLNGAGIGIGSSWAQLVSGKVDEYDVALGGAMIVLLEVIQILEGSFGEGNLLARLPMALRWALYIVFINTIIWLGAYVHTPFIYFQF
ncbi:MAG: MBOAT family protein, partial [Proteobacteria bacterium]|nr:MBOAT family protein [Pseudomonadota bacterium]